MSKSRHNRGKDYGQKYSQKLKAKKVNDAIRRVEMGHGYGNDLDIFMDRMLKREKSQKHKNY
jgi:hypothetical protein